MDGSGNALPQRQTARDLVAAALRSEILSGELAPGDRLIAPDIADRFRVSQTPAREAIQSLEAEGLVVSQPYKGAAVASLDADECEEIYLMRDALERLAARLGTERIGESGIALMDARLAEMRAAANVGDIDGFLEADHRFHEAHYAAAGRSRLWERILSLRYAGERYTRLSYRLLPHELESAIPNHAALIERVRHGDAAGASDWVSSTLLRVPPRTRELLEQAADGAGVIGRT